MICGLGGGCGRTSASMACVWEDLIVGLVSPLHLATRIGRELKLISAFQSSVAPPTNYEHLPPHSRSVTGKISRLVRECFE